MATTSYSTVRARTTPLNFRNGLPPWDLHFFLVRNHGYSAAHKDQRIYVPINDTFFGKTKENFFPGILDERISASKTCRFRKAALLLLGRERDPRKYWGSFIKTHPILLENFPKDQAHILKADIHEKAHMHQVGIRTTHEKDHAIADYYCELDADMSADTSLAEAGIGEETRKANLHARYIDMLFATSEYHFAAAMEDLKARKEPRNFFKTFATVAEIQLRLAEKLSRFPFADAPSEAVQNAINCWRQEGNVHQFAGTQYVDTCLSHYDNCRNIFIRKNTATLFTNLRKVIEDNIFTDPFTQRVATRIVEAAYYFNPDLVMADHDGPRKRLDERMRAAHASTYNIA